MQQVAEDIVNRRTRFTMEGSAIEDGR
jgi:hypothetical protein